MERHLCAALGLVLGCSGEHNSICAHVASSARDRAEIVTQSISHSDNEL